MSINSCSYRSKSHHVLAEGLAFPDEVHYGLNACCEACYDTYRPLFSRAIRDYHQCWPSASLSLSPTQYDRVNNDADEFDIRRADQQGLHQMRQLDELMAITMNNRQGDVHHISSSVLPKTFSVRCRIARNIKLTYNDEAFRFCSSMDSQERQSVETVLLDALQRASLAVYGRYGHYTRIDDHKSQRHKTITDRLYRFGFADPSPTMEAAGLARDWPHNRGLWLAPDGETFAWINEEDHLRLGCIQHSNVLQDVLNKVETMESAILACSGTLQFCRDDGDGTSSFGFLTTCLTNVYTGMRCSVMITSPNIIRLHGLDELKRIAKQLGLSVRGARGQHSRVSAANGVVDISNRGRCAPDGSLDTKAIVKCVMYGVSTLLQIEASLNQDDSNDDDDGDGDHAVVHVIGDDTKSETTLSHHLRKCRPSPPGYYTHFRRQYHRSHHHHDENMAREYDNNDAMILRPRVIIPAMMAMDDNDADTSFSYGAVWRSQSNISLSSSVDIDTEENAMKSDGDAGVTRKDGRFPRRVWTKAKYAHSVGAFGLMLQRNLMYFFTPLFLTASIGAANTEFIFLIMKLTETFTDLATPVLMFSLENHFNRRRRRRRRFSAAKSLSPSSSSSSMMLLTMVLNVITFPMSLSFACLHAPTSVGFGVYGYTAASMIYGACYSIYTINFLAIVAEISASSSSASSNGSSTQVWPPSPSPTPSPTPSPSPSPSPSQSPPPLSSSAAFSRSVVALSNAAENLGIIVMFIMAAITLYIRADEWSFTLVALGAAIVFMLCSLIRSLHSLEGVVVTNTTNITSTYRHHTIVHHHHPSRRYPQQHQRKDLHRHSKISCGH